MLTSALLLSLSTLLLGFRTARAQNHSLPSVQWRTGNAKVDSLVERLTPQEKISLVHGTTDDLGTQYQAGYVAPIPRLGIPAVRLTDGEA